KPRRQTCSLVRRRSCDNSGFGKGVFDDIGFRALDEGEDFRPFGGGNVEHIQSSVQMHLEGCPVSLVDSQPFMGSVHVATSVKQRSTCALTKEIDEELLFTSDTVFGSMCPKTSELRIRHQTRKQIICDRGESIITAKTRVQTFLFAHNQSPVLLIHSTGTGAVYTLDVIRYMALIIARFFRMLHKSRRLNLC